MMTKEEILKELSSLRRGSTFLTIHNYVNNFGEISNFQIAFHASYMSMLQRSIEKLRSYEHKNELEEQAKNELLASWRASIERFNEGDFSTVEDIYFYPVDEDGELIRGCKFHLDTENLHINGVLVNKVVVQPVKYKEVNSKPLTLAKRALEAGLPISKYRQFVIKKGRFERLRVEKVDILPPID